MDPVEIRPHPPERRRKPGVVAPCCCCCCCCCLHSIGGLVGAAVGGRKARAAEERSTVRIYWLAFVLVLAATGVACAFTREGGLYAVLGLMALPVGQLMTSLLVFLFAVLRPDLVDFRTLGRITWTGFVWALASFVVMILALILISR